MPYIKKEEYYGKTKASREAQLGNLQRGRRKGAIKARETSPELDPFSPVYKHDICRFLEDHFFIPESRSTVKIERWQRKEIFEPLFKVDPGTGLRQHSLAVVSMPKKNGKSCLAAMVAQFFMFQDEPFGEIILTANSKDQSSWVVFDKLVKSLSMNENTFREVIISDDTIKVKKTQTIVRIIAPNYKTAAGANPTLVVFDELWGFELSTARKFWDELVTVPTRKQPLTLVVSYAGHDEDSLLFELWEKGRSKDKPKNFFFYWEHRNLASWITKKYLREQRQRPGMRPNVYLRLHENRWCSYESSFIDIAFWDSCVQNNHRPLLPDKSKRLFLGVDIGLKRDTTGVVAVYKQENRIYLACHKCWRPTRKTPVRLEEIEAYILQLRKDFSIHELLYDPHQFERSAEILRGKWGIKLRNFDQTTRNLAYMTGILFDILKGGNIVLYKDKELRNHIENSTVKPTDRGDRIIKKKASSKIDLCIALGMACVSCIEAPSYSGNFKIILGEKEQHQSLRHYESPVTGATWGVGSPRDLLGGRSDKDNREPDGKGGFWIREKTGRDKPAFGQAIPDK